MQKEAKAQLIRLLPSYHKTSGRLCRYKQNGRRQDCFCFTGAVLDMFGTGWWACMPSDNEFVRESKYGEWIYVTNDMLDLVTDDNGDIDLEKLDDHMDEVNTEAYYEAARILGIPYDDSGTNWTPRSDTGPITLGDFIDRNDDDCDVDKNGKPLKGKKVWEPVIELVRQLPDE